MDFRLQQALDELNDATRGLDEAALDAPRGSKWTGANILEHLALSYKLTVKGAEKCLEVGRPLATRASLQQRLGAFVLITLGYFPKGRKSPERVLPRGMPAGEVLKTIREDVVAMDAALTRAEERFGRKTKLADHPVLGALTVDQWRRFHRIHARHHMKQIRALKEAVAAPELQDTRS